MMKRLGEWIYDNPMATMMVIFFVTGLFFAFLVWLTGCAPRPPRFTNGDRTVFGPPTHGEVVEDDMAKPGPD